MASGLTGDTLTKTQTTGGYTQVDSKYTDDGKYNGETLLTEADAGDFATADQGVKADAALPAAWEMRNSSFTAVPNRRYSIHSASDGVSVTLPPGTTEGDTIEAEIYVGSVPAAFGALTGLTAGQSVKAVWDGSAWVYFLIPVALEIAVSNQQIVSGHRYYISSNMQLALPAAVAGSSFELWNPSGFLVDLGSFTVSIAGIGQIVYSSTWIINTSLHRDSDWTANADDGAKDAVIPDNATLSAMQAALNLVVAGFGDAFVATAEKTKALEAILRDGGLPNR